MIKIRMLIFWVCWGCLQWLRHQHRVVSSLCNTIEDTAAVSGVTRAATCMALLLQQAIHCMTTSVLVWRHLIRHGFSIPRASLVAQTVNNRPEMWEIWVRSRSWADPQEEGMATHSSILAWRIPMERGSWRATVHSIAKSRTQQAKQQQHCSSTLTQKHSQGNSARTSAAAYWPPGEQPISKGWD